MMIYFGICGFLSTRVWDVVTSKLNRFMIKIYILMRARSANSWNDFWELSSIYGSWRSLIIILKLDPFRHILLCPCLCNMVSSHQSVLNEQIVSIALLECVNLFIQSIPCNLFNCYQSVQDWSIIMQFYVRVHGDEGKWRWRKLFRFQIMVHEDWSLIGFLICFLEF
jgi:hypothetical protein